jgi:hypothetical protein
MGYSTLPIGQGKGCQQRKHTYYCVLRVFRNDGSLSTFELTKKGRFEDRPPKNGNAGFQVQKYSVLVLLKKDRRKSDGTEVFTVVFTERMPLEIKL